MSIRSTAFGLVWSFAALVPGTLAGCGSGDETARIKLVPVNGTVKLNGQPLEGATVTFSPDDANDPNTPGGDVTGPGGNYKAMFRGRSGLSPGKYKIVVTKTLLPPGVAKAEAGDEAMYLESLRDPKGAASLVQAQAATQIRGDFESDVPAGGGTLDFDVQKKEAPVPGAGKKP